MSEQLPVQPQPPRPSLVENEGVDAGSRDVLEEPKHAPLVGQPESGSDVGPQGDGVLEPPD